MTLAGGALREGLIYGLLGNNHDCDARDRTADSLISRYQLDKEHAERVRDTAIEAFTQLQPAWRLSSATVARSCVTQPCCTKLVCASSTKKAPQHAAYIIDNIDMPGFTPAQKKLLSALLFNQRDEFKLEPLEKQGAVTGRQAIRLARILRISSSSACAGPRALCPGSCCKPMKMP